MEKGQKYSCYYVGGDGIENMLGLWEITSLTEKQIIIKRYEQSKRPGYMGDIKELKVFRDGHGRNGFRDWQDGTFTVYPNKGGTPFVFIEI